MSASLTTGLLTISIDVEAPVARSDERALASLTAVLVDQLKRYRLPATWAIAEPADSAPALRMGSRAAGHEVALLADASWAGPEVSRSGFGRELVKRIGRASAGGISITSLALAGGHLDDRCDLAHKQGISAVRHPQLNRRAGRSLQPRTLPFGLWSFPVVLALPGTSRWLPGGGGGGSAQAMIDTAIRSGGLVQLVIDAPRMAARGAASCRVLDRVLRHVELRRRQTALAVASLSGAVAILAGRNQRQPSRSILRPAA